MADLPGGWVRFDATGEAIGPGTTSAQIAATEVGRHAATHFTGDGSRLVLGRLEIGGQRFDVTAHFTAGRLARLELFAPLAADGRSWSDWSHQGEMARKHVHERWAAAYFGRPMEPKPIEVEGLTQPGGVVPFEVGEDYPRHARFEWGEVLSWYDGKAGQAGLAVSYV